jgi:tetratricopeptide (TPR) repeat protein
LDALALSHEKATAYAPLIDLLHDYFRITPDDDARTRREKVAGKVAMLDRSLEETLPLLFALLGIVDGVDPLAGMDEGIRRRRTQDAVKGILLRESLNQPLMLIFEDLHWIDDATQGFLKLLAESLASAQVLLLVNYRPEYTHLWSSKTYYAQLRLDPLGEESAAEMLSARIGDSPELVPVKQLVLERTEGNPLFIEELVEALFDEGVLVRNGAVKVTRPLSQLKIPPTVEGILAARIDRLPPDAKELLQTLAVIGSEFPLALVRRVVQLPEDRLHRLLDVLQAGEFIYEQPEVSDVGYIFKHALTRDEAQKSLLTDRRKLLHERTAKAIEALYGERLEDHYVNLAHHYRLSDNATKAVEYLRLASEQAVDRGEYAQALANLEPALQLIERLPVGSDKLRAELGVRLMEGRTATVLHGIGSEERLQVFQRVCELSEQLRDDSTLLIGLVNVGFAYSNQMEASRARLIARRCVELSVQAPDREVPRYVHLLVGWCAYGSGELSQASSQLGDLMTHLVSPRRRPAAGIIIDPWALAPSMFALTQLALGRPDNALKLSEESVRRARQLNHPFMLAQALGNQAILRYHRREPEVTGELAKASGALAAQYGFRERLAIARMFAAWAMTELGQMDQGLFELERGFTSATKYAMYFIPMEMMFESAYLHAGRADRALEMLDEALARVEHTGAHIGMPELYRFKARALLLRDPPGIVEAEECFRRAIEIAKGQSAKWWELRATVSLAPLLRDTGRRDEARTMLAEIYNWFTEGFDTADLKDAKALLDELSD